MENRDFGNPAEAPTPLTKRCLELFKKPLNEFSAEDLRLMIGQGASLNYLIPLAFDFLKENLLKEGDLYPGDLLKSVQSVDEAFWESNPKLRKELNGLIDGKRKPISESLQSRITFLQLAIISYFYKNEWSKHANFDCPTRKQGTTSCC